MLTGRFAWCVKTFSSILIHDCGFLTYHMELASDLGSNLRCNCVGLDVAAVVGHRWGNILKEVIYSNICNKNRFIIVNVSGGT